MDLCKKKKKSYSLLILYLFYFSAFVFGLTVCGFSIAHTQFILVNRTTIESLSTRPDHIRVDFDTSGHNYEVVNTSLHDRFWNIGKMNNWKNVMGKNPLTWFCKFIF